MKTTFLKGDINNNGKIDNSKEVNANIQFNAEDIKKLQTQIRLLKRITFTDVTNKQNEFASSAKIAEELSDGKQRVFFNNVNKSVVFKNSNKQMSSCVQICSNDNSIKNISHIHFNNSSTIKGLINDFNTTLTENESNYYAPSMNYLLNYVDPSLEVIGGNLTEVNNKIHDISYNENNSTTSIANNLEINGNINCSWLDSEFSKYALLNHTHEFADIYKSITKTIVNQNTNEEEEITETKTLQEILTEYEQNLTSAINSGLNTKANISHTHEISNIYKTIVNPNDNTTTQKSLETLINEKESALQSLISGKANSSHSHNATEINYKNNVNVKQELDNINSQLDIKDENGNKIDILAAIFGTTTGVGTLIDGGLIAAVGTLQEEIALLQTQVATLATADLTSDVIDAVDFAGDVVESGSSVWKGLKGIANAFKEMKTVAKSYINLASDAAIPLSPL